MMAARIVHGRANTRDRVPSGHVLARCGAVVPRRLARTSGVNCPLCLVVAATTIATTATVTRNRRGGGQR